MKAEQIQQTSASTLEDALGKQMHQTYKEVVEAIGETVLPVNTGRNWTPYAADNGAWLIAPNNKDGSEAIRTPHGDTVRLSNMVAGVSINLMALARLIEMMTIKGIEEHPSFARMQENFERLCEIATGDNYFTAKDKQSIFMATH